jgi:hypothetical protein
VLASSLAFPPLAALPFAETMTLRARDSFTDNDHRW